MRNPLAATAVALAFLVVAPPAHADGDVAAFVNDDGLLELLGDDAPNQIEVRRSTGDETYTVTGLGGTTVNGRTSVAIAGAKGLVARLEGGNDRLELLRTRINGHLRVSLGDGHDTLLMIGIRVQRRTTIRGGHGLNLIVSDNGSIFKGRVRIRTDGGVDTVELLNSTFHSRTRVETKDGDDVVRLGRLRMSGRASSMDVVTGRGNDRVRILGSRFDAAARVFTYKGEDYVKVDNCRFKNELRIDTGRHDDHVRVTDNDIDDEMKLYGGSGRDHLHFRDNSVRHREDRKIRGF